MTYHPRSAWTSTPKTGSRLKQNQTEIYVHWPATAGMIGTNTERIKDYLRAWLKLHTKDRGWSDIAYNIGVDQNGDEWELRGIDRQCGGNGGTVTNRRGQAILAIMGMDEAPSPAMIRGIQRAVARIRRKHPTATKILGHRDSFEASTSCPGTKLYALVKSGAFEPAGGAPLPSESGNSGLADVGKSQGWLADLGYDPGPQDGTFGTRTATATRAFQQEYGITPADGRPGPATRQVLEAEVSKLDDISKKLDQLPRQVWGIGGGANAPMIGRRYEKGSEYPETTLGSMTDRIVRQQLVPLRKEVAAQGATIQTLADLLAKQGGLDPTEIRKAVADGMDDALGSLEVTVTGPAGAED